MAQILGLTISHYPNLRFKYYMMPNVLIGNMGPGWRDKPHLKNPRNWPVPMQEEWGNDQDQGATLGAKAQEHQIENFRKIRAALDQFNPDFMVMMYRDLGETFRDPVGRPPYWIHAQDKVSMRLFQLFGRRENYHEEDPERVDTILGHREAALFLARGLQESGFSPKVVDVPTAPTGLGHNCMAGIVHTDFDRRQFKTPVVAIGVDPFGFGRQRNNEGMSKFDPTAPNPPLTPKQGFELGRAMARIYHRSPWKVALVASTAWSHGNNSGWEFERLHADRDADLKRYQEWSSNQFTKWGDTWTWEQMEQHAEWECLISIILAGAMTEIGSKVTWSDFMSHYILNSTWVSTIFEAK
jgi:hypothetical protein